MISRVNSFVPFSSNSVQFGLDLGIATENAFHCMG